MKRSTIGTGEQRVGNGIPGRVVWPLVAIAVGLFVAHSASARARQAAAGDLVRAAIIWLDSLEPAQRSSAAKPFDDATRTDWHFVPKPARKGLQLRSMTERQQAAALVLLRSALSQAGYDKSVAIMELDEILRVLEGSRAKNIRDPKRYFFTIYGTPSNEGRWGLSVEGHHLSLNVTIRDGRIVDSTPQFMGANPAEVRRSLPGLPTSGHRVLEQEEAVAFELIRSFDAGQRAKAVIAAEPPREIRGAGSPQPPDEAAAGIGFGDLSEAQQTLLRRLVDVYCEAMPEDVAMERRNLIEAADGGWTAVKFAWAGSLEPGVGHSYRVEGPTFLIELANTQPDAEGNPANHIHCVWRDRTGDFDLPAR